MDHSRGLLKEVDLIGQQYGEKAQARTCEVLKEVAIWTRINGHGNITLSAVNHLLGNKIRTETIITTKG